MKILFLTVVGIDDITERGIYNDLMRHFNEKGHEVYIASPKERRYHQRTNLKVQNGVHMLSVKTLNIQKTNLLEKGIGTLLLERQFLNAIKKYFSAIKFDLVLYATPPITFTRVIQFIKDRDHAKSYLLLKDIFPQNAIDLQMLKKNGFLHQYFRKKESRLYAISDYIGCMSQANVDYILDHHTIAQEKVEINPNSLAPLPKILRSDRQLIRKKHAIPTDSLVFIYGGNLGKPQGVDFLINVLISNHNKEKIFFVIVGNGTEFSKLNRWFSSAQPSNAILLKSLPKAEYDLLLSACDVGLIFLDKRFTIPNFPSRLLSYLECKMPVIAATDTATDLGKIITENKFGYWCESGDTEGFNKACELMTDIEDRERLGANGYHYLLENYLVSHSYQIVMKHFSDV